MSRLPCFLLLVLLLVTWTTGQFVVSRDKPGACPPKSSVRYNPDDCDYGCNEDVDCPGIYKCCENECGSRCVPPVTQARSRALKRGNCPARPTGRWICTSTCSGDFDCRGNYKCCLNRCGAYACIKPEA